MTNPQLRSICLARVQDAEEIAVMSRDYIEQGLGWSWTPSRVSRALRSRECCGIVLRGDTRIAGFAIMVFGDEIAHLSLLAVEPNSRRQGIARALFGWMRESAVVAGVERIDLELRADNLLARAFYESEGFAARGLVERYYRNTEAALRMSLALRPASTAPR